MARFWRLQASISKGFGTDFSKMFDVFWAPLVSYQRFKFIAKSGQIVAKMWAFISPCAFSNAVLQMQAFNAWQSPNILAHKWGGGGGPPLGEFNPPATEGVQGVLDHKPIVLSYMSISMTDGESERSSF